jgi:hypothetical protein
LHTKTESTDVILKDIELFYGPMLVLISTENNSLKTKALNLFNSYMMSIKQILNQSEKKQIWYLIFLSYIFQFEKIMFLVFLFIHQSMIALKKSIQEYLKTSWIQIEPSRVFISLNMIARHKLNLIDEEIKDLIIERVEETQSKFRYNVELKNTLFTFFEFLEGDQGKVFLNKRLGFLWY